MKGYFASICTFVSCLAFFAWGMAAAPGCSWWGANSKTVTSDVGQIAACVIGDLVKGVSDPTQIVKDCDGAAVADIVAIIDSLLSDPKLGEARRGQLTSTRQRAAEQIAASKK